MIRINGNVQGFDSATRHATIISFSKLLSNKPCKYNSCTALVNRWSRVALKVSIIQLAGVKPAGIAQVNTFDGFGWY